MNTHATVNAPAQHVKVTGIHTAADYKVPDDVTPSDNSSKIGVETPGTDGKAKGKGKNKKTNTKLDIEYSVAPSADEQLFDSVNDDQLSASSHADTDEVFANVDDDGTYDKVAGLKVMVARNTRAGNMFKLDRPAIMQYVGDFSADAAIKDYHRGFSSRGSVCDKVWPGEEIPGHEVNMLA